MQCLNAHIIKGTVIFYCCILLSACGSESSGSQDDEQIDSEILLADNSTYSNIYHKLLADERFDSNFYQEQANNSDKFYTIRHVKNHDVELYDVGFTYPLCSDDYASAFNTSKNDSSQTTSHLIANTESDIYYEFSRQNQHSSNSIYVQRIYKCQVYQVSSVNQYKGQYVNAVLDIEDYHKFIEYQWYFSYYNNYGNVVLSSTVKALSENETQVVIINASIESYDTCDEVHVTEHYFILNHDSREINRYQITRDIFYAKNLGNTTKVCQN